MTAIVDTKRKRKPIRLRREKDFVTPSIGHQLKARVTAAYLTSSRAVRRAAGSVVKMLRSKMFTKVMVVVSSLFGIGLAWGVVGALVVLAFMIHPILGWVALVWAIGAILVGIPALAEFIELQMLQVDVEHSSKKMAATLAKLPSQR